MPILRNRAMLGKDTLLSYTGWLSTGVRMAEELDKSVDSRDVNPCVEFSDAMLCLHEPVEATKNRHSAGVRMWRQEEAEKKT